MPDRSTPFGVERSGDSIRTASVRHRIQTGITFRAPYPGIVPEMEEREAAMFASIRFLHWQKMTREERVDGVAHYRLHHLVEMHSEDAVSTAMEARERKVRRGGS